MAAVQREDVIHVTPPGQEVTDRGYATTAIKRGDPVKIVGNGPTVQWDYSVAALAAGDPDSECIGFSLKDTSVGGTAEFASQGEMDGFVGLTPNALLTIVAGKIDDTAPTEAAFPRIRAVNSTRIRFVTV